MALLDRRRGLLGMEVASWIELVLGATIIVAAVFTPGPLAARIATMAVGAFVLVVAGHEEWDEHHGRAGRVDGPAALLGLAALWLAAYGLFLYAYAGGLASLVLVGVALVLLGTASYNVRAAARWRGVGWGAMRG